MKKSKIKIVSGANKIILYSVWFLVFLVPLAFFPDIKLESLKLGIVYFVASILLFSWLLKAFVLKKLIIRHNIFLPFILLFLLGLLLTIPFSNDINTSFFGEYIRLHGGLLSYLAYSSIFLVVVNSFDIKEVKQTLVIAIVSAIFVAILGIVHYFALDAPRAYATLQIPGSYASYLAIFFFISVGFMLESKHNIVKSLFLISSIVLYLGFTFSYVRGTTLGLIAGIILFTILFIYMTNRTNSKAISSPKKNMRFLVPLASIILLTNIFFGNALVNRPFIELPQERGLTEELVINPGGVNRLVVWRGTINAIKQNPMFGFGLETFYTNFLAFRPVEMNYTTEWDTYFDRSHNEYLQFFATTGLVGGLSYLLLISSTAIFTFKIIRKKNSDFISISIIGALVSYLTHLFFLFSVTTTAFLFFLLLAMLVIINREYKEITIDLNFLNFVRYKLLFGGLITSLFILSVYYSSIFTLSEIYVARSISAFRQLNLEESYNFMKKARSINKFQPLYNTELAKNASIYAALTEDDKQKEVLIREVEILNNRAVSNHTSNILLLFGARDAYSNLDLYLPDNQSYLEKAIKIQQKIVRMSPTSAIDYYKLARFQKRTKDLRSAELSAKSALKLKNNYTDAKMFLATIYKKQGRDEEFQRISEELEAD